MLCFEAITDQVCNREGTWSNIAHVVARSEFIGLDPQWINGIFKSLVGVFCIHGNLALKKEAVIADVLFIAIM